MLRFSASILRSTHENPDYITQVENIIGGMRGLKSMLWEASVLDPIEAL